MATLYLHVGQAGCQIGQSFWAPLVDEIAGSDTLDLALCHQHLRHQRQPRAKTRQQLHRSIFVDTESKALHDAVKAIGAKRIGPCIRFGVKGRGSCFPMGFEHGFGEAELDEHFDFVRQEAEKCDYLSAFVMTHSFGGGTGSGLGSRLLLWIRDSFPLINSLAVSCGGFAHESPVQNYNAILALARLQSLCDGIVLFNNEHVVSNAKQTAAAATTSGTSGSSLSDVNAEICLSLHGAFLPSASLNAGGSGVGQNGSASGAFKLKSGAAVSFNMEPLELVRTLAPMPSHKILQIDTVSPGREDSTTNLIQALSRTVKRPWAIAGAVPSVERDKLKLLGLTVVARHGAVVDDNAVTKLKESLPFVPWNPFPVDVWRGDDTFCVPRMRKTNRVCLTACSNSNRFVPLLRRWTEKAKGLVNAGAFLHWFEKYGCDGDQIREAAICVEDVVQNYEDL